ncbi:hypothetical protein ENBRE01_3107, partial [Enteropsectra breve]
AQDVKYDRRHAERMDDIMRDHKIKLEGLDAQDVKYDRRHAERKNAIRRNGNKKEDEKKDDEKKDAEKGDDKQGNNNDDSTDNKNSMSKFLDKHKVIIIVGVVALGLFAICGVALLITMGKGGAAGAELV